MIGSFTCPSSFYFPVIWFTACNFMVKTVKTDVLVIGGGLSGCMAAINAADHGTKVAIMEKSHTERSGAA